jgi:excisionase family DNA binding protein
MSNEGLLTVIEAAQYLRLNPRTVSNKAKDGSIPARKVGGHWRFDPEDLRIYDESQQRSDQMKPEQT